MTTLVGIHVSGGGTWLAADSMTSTEDIRVSGVRKIVHGPNWVMAMAGDLRALNLVEANAGTVLKPETPFEVTEALEVLFRSSGFSCGFEVGRGEAGAPAWGQRMLLADHTGLWDFDSTLSVYQVPPNCFWAAGSGGGIALGAGTAAMQHGATPEEAIRIALDLASKYDPGTGGEPEILRLVDPGPKPVRKSRKPKEIAAPVAQ